MSLATVSGVGAVSCVGIGAEALWLGMGEAVARISDVKDPYLRGTSGQMYQATDVPPDATYRGGRASRLAVLAAIEATRESRGYAPVVPAARVGVVVGTGMGDAAAHEQERHWPRPVPMYEPAARVARAVGAQGPVVSLSNACAASAYAIDMARGMLAAGECDRVVVVGAEVYSRIALFCFERIHAMDPRSCRPFALDRAGTLFGEGAGALVLDGSGVREPRPGDIVVKSSMTSSDGGHPTAPDPTGVPARRAFFGALERAGVDPGDIGAILPHGTGTQLNDEVEAHLLKEMNGLAGRTVPAYCLKGLVGHTGGAAGALAAVAGVLMSRHRTVPRNVDVGELLPDVEESVGAQDRELTGDVVVNAYAFGGANASVVIGGVR